MIKQKENSVGKFHYAESSCFKFLRNGQYPAETLAYRYLSAVLLTVVCRGLHRNFYKHSPIKKEFSLGGFMARATG